MPRVLAIAFLLLALAACGRQADLAPFLQSRTPSGLAERFYPPEGWAWGAVQAGEAPAQRYGVASPPVTPRAQVLIVTGTGESAEAWFETARDMIARGVTVWVLERAGQAGSGRYAGPRDLAHAPDLDADIAAVHAMAGVVIRPTPPRPLVILAQGDGAVVALRALETGAPADGLILTSPRLAQAPAERMETLLVRAGLGRLPAPGRRPWRRDQPDGLEAGSTHDPWRGRVQQAWEIANPDLRMSGESLGWRAASATAAGLAMREAKAVRQPVLLLAPSPDDVSTGLCGALPECRVQPIPGARPALHLEADRFRKPWLDQVTAFVAARIDPREPQLPSAP